MSQYKDCKFAFWLQYDGTNYAGFQKQKDEFSTVQLKLEEAFQKIFYEKIVVHPAGRTDAGVHAIGQVFHIKLKSYLLEKYPLLFANNKIVHYLNSILPIDIRVLYFQKVPDDFHARYSCISREYKYVIYNYPFSSCFYTKYSLWMKKPLNIAAMQQASQYLIGKNDYSSFTKNIYKNTKISLFREIEYIKIQTHLPFIIFSIKGKSFLHNMIRILIGTIIEVGLGKKNPHELQTTLRSKNRKQAGQTLPAHGLFFYKAFYLDFPRKDIANGFFARHIEFPILLLL